MSILFYAKRGAKVGAAKAIPWHVVSLGTHSMVSQSVSVTKLHGLHSSALARMIRVLWACGGGVKLQCSPHRLP